MLWIWLLAFGLSPTFMSAPAIAQAANADCPDLAPVAAWARRNNYAFTEYSEAACGDFTGDGAMDAVVHLEADEEWSGNGMAPYGVILFRNVGGRLQHLRTVSTPDDLKVYGSAYEPTRFERGRIVLTHHTLTEQDSRCCPTGVTAFTIDTNTGRVSERLLRRMDEAEQQRLVDRANAESGDAPMAQAPRDLPAAIAPPPAWSVQQAGTARYAYFSTGNAAMPELSVSCLPNRQVQFGASLPTVPAGALSMQLATSDGRSVALSRGWRRHPSGSWFIRIDGAAIDLLSGGAPSVRLSLNGREAGTISLRGAHSALRQALSPCWAWPPVPVRR